MSPSRESMRVASGPSLSVGVSDPSTAGEVRRKAVALARKLGFSEEEAGRVAVIATELATNIAKHGLAGEILLRALGTGGIEILALDRGRGMADVASCLRDGYSTAGSPGTGLGAVRRLADTFDVFSASGNGTAVVAQLWTKAARRTSGRHLTIGAVCVPAPGEIACGDGWDASTAGNRLQAIVVDGLGHGPIAAEAATEAVRVFGEKSTQGPDALMTRLNGALRKTRGAAVALVEVDAVTHDVAFTGVGNIAATILGPGRRYGMASVNGIVGHGAHKIREFHQDWPERGVLVLHSDGLQSRWRLDQEPYIRLVAHHPSLIAGVLYRDFRRGHDDVTVVVVKEGTDV